MSSWTIPSSQQKTKKRKGRGSGSGLGKTAGRGHKGQRARSGSGPRIGFEGGQTPLYRRLPKFGFTNIFRKDVQVVNLHQLNRLPEKVVDVTPKVLWQHRLIQNPKGYVKILGQGEVGRKFNVQSHFYSKTAKEKIEKSGGSVQDVTSK